MRLPTGSHTLGPENASIHLKTYRQGMAAKAGHDLVMEVTRWDGALAVTEGGAQSTVALTADPGSLEVREALHGVKPLSDKDRADIKKNTHEKVLRGAPIRFRSSAIEASGEDGQVAVTGELEIAGETRPICFGLSIQPDGAIEGGVTVTQSEWGIKPYSALMGTLKVRDAIDVVFAAKLPAR